MKTEEMYKAWYIQENEGKWPPPNKKDFENWLCEKLADQSTEIKRLEGLLKECEDVLEDIEVADRFSKARIEHRSSLKKPKAWNVIHHSVRNILTLNSGGVFQKRMGG